MWERLPDLNLFGVIVLMFLFVLALLWFLLPFMVNGINSKLSRIIGQNEKIISHLDRIRNSYFSEEK